MVNKKEISNVTGGKILTETTKPNGTAKAVIISDVVWLNYFNNYLFENGIITADEQSKMNTEIRKRYRCDGGNTTS